MRSLINSPVFVDYIDYMNEAAVSEDTTTSTLEFDEFRRKLEAAKKSLSDTQLKVFELSKEWALSHAEIAGRLNLSEQTVKNQLSIALKILRKKLSDSAGMFALFFL
jgi:RNA polymerase sigma-70 factor (ECF subfamily)